MGCRLLWVAVSLRQTHCSRQSVQAQLNQTLTHPPAITPLDEETIIHKLVRTGTKTACFGVDLQAAKPHS